MLDALNISTPFSDPVLIFAIVMLIILLAPLLFNKMKIPGIVGLILAGTLVGPSILGMLERDDTINLLGTVGLLYLMFMAGLSIDLNRFEKLRNRSIGFGAMSFFIPQVMALAAGFYWLDYSLATSLLLGSIVGSHTLLAYPIVERLGITKNTGVTMSMGGTLVTDTLSLGVLAVIAGSVNGDAGTSYWVGFAASVGIFVAATLIILPRLGRWFFRNVKYQNNTDYVFMIAVLFTTAFLADVAGLAPIIGAFLAGLLLNRLVPTTGTLMNRVQFVGNTFFIPFFLISVGMLVDVQVLGSLDVWVKTIIFTGLVFFGKGIAALLSNLFFGYSKAEGLVIYGLTTPQSAATLAVTLIGFDLGFFDQTAVNAVVIMILFTCLVGPWLVEKYGRIVAIQEDEKPYELSDAQQRILVPLANPETSDALMDIAFMVRDSKSGQPILPLTVARDGSDVESQVVRGEKMLSHAVIHAAAAEVPVNPITRIDLSIAKGIARAVSEKLVSNIIIGWNGQISAKQRIFGSILDQLLEEIDEMVMVCKIEKPVNTFNRIVVAVPPFAALETGFAESMRAIKLMADQIGGDLVIIATHDRESYVKKRVEKIKPALDFKCFTISLWAELPKWLDENTKDEDLFVLVSAREGSLSWRPGLDRLPRVISQRYPELSFITVYPSESQQNLLSIGYRGLEMIQPENVQLNLTQDTIDKLLEQIIRENEAFSNIDLSKIIGRLLENSANYTPEVMPGVMLFEAHTSLVKEQMLFIGVSEAELNVQQAANPVHVFLILFSPKEVKPDDHLKGLNTIIKLIKPGKGVEDLRKAKTPKDVVKLLLKKN